MTSVVRSVVTCQADADVSLPSPLLLSPFLALSLSLVPFSLPPFILPSLFPPLSIFLRLSLSPPPPPDATRERNPIRAPLVLSLPRLFSRNVSSRFDPRDHPLLPPTLHHRLFLLALSLAGIFSLLPRPSSLVSSSSSSSLCQLPSSTLSRFFSLFSTTVPMARSAALFSRSISNFP